jgi:hypothetical protein
MSIIRPNQINIDNLTYSEQRPFGDHAKIVYINQNGSPIIMQTPVMITPFGLSKFEDKEKMDRVKYSIDLSFRNKDENKKIKDLFDVLKKIDDKVTTDASKKSQEWFKKKNLSKEVCKELYVGSIKVSSDEDKYPPTFKLKVPFYDQKFAIQSFNMDSGVLIEDSLETVLDKGSSVQAIAKLKGLWFAGSKFGLMWEVQQLKLKPKENLQSYAFIDSDDENDDDDNRASHENNNLVVSDGEEDDL